MSIFIFAPLVTLLKYLYSDTSSVQNTIRLNIESMKADINRSQRVKESVDKHLADTHFTKLAKQHELFKSEMKTVTQAGLKMDRIMHDGALLKKQREEKFNQNQDALKKVIQDITSIDVIKFITSNDSVSQPEQKKFEVNKTAPVIQSKPQVTSAPVKPASQVQQQPKTTS